MAKQIDKAVKVNGAKYFFYKVPGGEWKGTLKQQCFWSRTFLPENTQVKEAESKELLLNILKTDKVPLKESNLDADTKAELDKAKISYEKISDINPIDVKRK